MGYETVYSISLENYQIIETELYSNENVENYSTPGTKLEGYYLSDMFET